MARPLNSVKPLYQQPTARPGRPSSPKLAIGYLGPVGSALTNRELEQALVIGQTIAAAGQLAVALADAPILAALARGIRDKSGTIAAFSAAKKPPNPASPDTTPGLDLLLPLGSETVRQKLLLDSIDALIIQAYPNSSLHLKLPLTKTIPVGVLIDDRASAQQVAHIASLAQPSQSPIEYADQPRALVELIIKAAKARRRAA